MTKIKMTNIILPTKPAEHAFEETCERDGASTRNFSAEKYPCSSKACSAGFVIT
jgi:hypothetical protein